MTALFTTAYWPNLHYCSHAFRHPAVLIEQHENYQKQSYRNRCLILSANGPLLLSIPVHKRGPKELVKDITISYQEGWPVRHWRAITSAYKNSPYFDFFEDELRPFYFSRFEHLLHYNSEQLRFIFKALKLKNEISLTQTFEKETGEVTDLRYLTDTKIDFRTDKTLKITLEKPYYQTFENKFPFHPNLSVLDLLFNTGLQTLAYLK